MRLRDPPAGRHSLRRGAALPRSLDARRGDGGRRGGTLFVFLPLAYQSAQFGSPFVDGYAAYEPTFRAIYGAHTAGSPLSLRNVVDGEQLWHHLDILRAFLVDWTVPGTILLAVLGWAATREDVALGAARRFSVALVALLGATLFVTIGGTDDGARPRYLSLALVPLAWLAARGWRAARDLLAQRLSGAARKAIGVTVAVLPLIQLGAFLVERTPLLWVREGLEQAVTKQGVDGVVVVRAEYPTRYARNGPFFDRPVLYVSAPAGMSAAEVSSRFPGRAVYEAREGKTWTLTRAAETP